MKLATREELEGGNVSVVVRVRPPNQREQDENHRHVVHVVDSNMLVFDPDEAEDESMGVFSRFKGHLATKQKGKDLKFVFDRVFSENASQLEVFEFTTKNILDGVLNGYNCSVFAYGATGAGKTHTMLGCEGNPGVMYLTMMELYRRIDAIKDEKRCEVAVSYLEVYNEQIHDLLEPKKPLAVREDRQKGVVVQGLSFHQPKSAEQLLEVLANGNKNRTQHPTDANATSSRSHAIFQIYVKQEDRIGSLKQNLRVAKMCLIDLAGSERASSTNASGERLREGANINRSLLALINVINALADRKTKKPHIPYRDSKLTRLLKDSIGGNCRTIMIAAVSPSAMSYEDTYNTLKYANRAKEIKLALKSNVMSLDCHISKYAAVCEELRTEVTQLREKLKKYEGKETGATGGTLATPGLTNQELDTFTEWDKALMEMFSCRRVSQMEYLDTEAQLKEMELRAAFQSRDRERLELLCEGKKLEQVRTVLVSALLKAVRGQYCVLKSAELLTPDVTSGLEELERLLKGEKMVTWADLVHERVGEKSPEKQQQVALMPVTCTVPPLVQTESGKMALFPLPATAQPSDVEKENVARQLEASRSTMPQRQATKRCLKELWPSSGLSNIPLNIPVKRLRSESSNRGKGDVPRMPEQHAKRIRRSILPKAAVPPAQEGRVKFLAPQVPDLLTGFPYKSSTPVIEGIHPLRSTPLQVTKPGPSTTVKSCTPLAPSTIQNGIKFPVMPETCNLNNTFELLENCRKTPDLAVTFAPSLFPGEENRSDGICKSSSSNCAQSLAVPKFTIKGPSGPLYGKRTTTPSTTKLTALRKRKSVSPATICRTGSHPRYGSKATRLRSGPVRENPTVPSKAAKLQASTFPRLHSNKKLVPDAGLPPVTTSFG
ncbi:kinesin-like protein KIF18B [Latimeria chalumnae]|uniref:kinesin-like protein KIF18B n=1 Tax=Latimeria chalumnae TaxID=7897 RepID=UPI00313C4352